MRIMSDESNTEPANGDHPPNQQLPDGGEMIYVPPVSEGSYKPKHGTEKKHEAIARRHQVGALLHSGHTNRRQLADTFHVSRSTISKDIDWLYRQWREETVDDQRDAKAKALKDLDFAKADLWKMLLASKHDFTETRVRTIRERIVLESDPTQFSDKTTTTTTVTTRPQTGDPRYMEQIIRIDLAQAKIMGVDGEVKVSIGADKSAIDLFAAVQSMEQDRTRICDSQFIDELVVATLEGKFTTPDNGEKTNGDGRQDGEEKHDSDEQDQ